MWDSINDAAPVYAKDAAPGPRLGFLGALEAAYDDQVRNSSVNGLAYHFMKADEQQAADAKKNGVEYTPFYRRGVRSITDQYTGENTEQYADDGSTHGMGAYYKIAKTIVDNEDNDTLGAFAEHDAQIMDSNSKNPYKLKTMTEMFEGVKELSARAKKQADLDTTWGGLAGSVIGGVAGSFNANTDPLNVASAALPTGGATALGRIALQGATQAGAELINQVTGVQENRRLLGLDYGVSNAAFSIIGAGVGGAALQGVGEGLGAVVRRASTGRWFADSPKDKAPPAPAQPVEQAIQPAPPRVEPTPDQIFGPMGDSRLGAPRAEADFVVIRNQLSDWGGPRPYEMAPPTDTRIPGAEPTTNFKLDFKDGVETLDSIARRVDPEAFAVYDKYAAIKKDAREQLVSMGAERNSAANNSVQNINDQIDQLRQKTDGATRRLGKKYETRIAELTKQRDQFLALETRGDTPEMAAMRQQLMEADYQLRDMAPVVHRAYAAAQTKWTSYTAERARIDKMIRDAEPGIENIRVDESTLPKEPPADLVPVREPVPERAEAMKIAKPGETLAATISRLNEGIQKAVDDTLDTFAAFAKTATKDVAEGELPETHIELTVNGKQVRLALDGDKISIPTDDGGVVKMTPRELLKDVHNDNEALQAITTCSISGTS